MPTIHAIYENGVFRPRDKVDLPERAEVEFEPRVVGQEQAGLGDIYAVLAERFASGERDVAERHDEHQP